MNVLHTYSSAVNTSVMQDVEMLQIYRIKETKIIPLYFARSKLPSQFFLADCNSTVCSIKVTYNCGIHVMQFRLRTCVDPS